MECGRVGISGVCTNVGGPSADWSLEATTIPLPEASAFLKKLRRLLTKILLLKTKSRDAAKEV
jgi:hypothetical protein